jgi:hypothetical protein
MGDQFLLGDYQMLAVLAQLQKGVETLLISFHVEIIVVFYAFHLILLEESFNFLNFFKVIKSGFYLIAVVFVFGMTFETSHV